MNSKVVFIAFLTLVALAGLIFYTFGPGAAGHAILTVNPSSLKPSPVATVTSSTTAAVNAYHNRDLVQNYYTIQFPQSWQLGPTQPGEYTFTFPSGTAKVETMDVADNTTLELFVLSQDEPKLKNSLVGYKQVNYQKIQVNGSDAYQLTYLSSQNGTTYQTIRTYITGADKAGVITLSVDVAHSAVLAPSFATVVDSFRWEK